MWLGNRAVFVQEPSALELLPLKLLPRCASDPGCAPPLWAQYIVPWIPQLPANVQAAQAAHANAELA